LLNNSGYYVITLGNVYEDWMDVQNDAEIDFLPIEFCKRKKMNA
jgi:hypothetical protein